MLPLKWQFSLLDGNRRQKSSHPPKTNKQTTPLYKPVMFKKRKKTCNVWRYIM